MSTKTNTPVKSLAVGLAAGVLALGGYLAGHSSSTSNASAAVPQTAQAGQLPRNGQGPPGGFGSVATGTAAAKAKAAALAKYSGTVQTVMKLTDGSYVVHVVTGSGELHVLVSSDFKVTGTQQGPPGGGAPPAAGATGSAGTATS
jgi:hypothetical protein